MSRLSTGVGAQRRGLAPDLGPPGRLAGRAVGRAERLLQLLLIEQRAGLLEQRVGLGRACGLDLLELAFGVLELAVALVGRLLELGAEAGGRERERVRLPGLDLDLGDADPNEKNRTEQGKHSGRHAFKDKLTSLGYPDLTDDVVDNAFAKFKILADKKKHVYDEDIIALIDDSLITDNKVSAINLKSLKVFAGTGEPQRAEMTLDVFGEVKKASETGDGPVDAIFKCIKKLYPHEVNLQLYQVHAVTEGTDAQATVSVKIEENGKTTVGQAADTDTLVASANAYINSLNKMIIKRDKTAPGTNIENQNFENQKMKGI